MEDWLGNRFPEPRGAIALFGELGFLEGAPDDAFSFQFEDESPHLEVGVSPGIIADFLNGTAGSLSKKFGDECRKVLLGDFKGDFQLVKPFSVELNDFGDKPLFFRFQVTT